MPRQAKKTVTKIKNKKKTEKKALTVDVYDKKGTVVGTMTLPAHVFDISISPALVAMSVRIYQANKRMGTRSTKTRGDVIGSTRKIYRQKGTGRARHGDIKAPIFIGGGVAHGPKPKDFHLTLPQKMRKKVLYGVLTDKLKNEHITILQDISGVEPKTKNMQKILTDLHLFDKKKREKILLALDVYDKMIWRLGRNIAYLTITQVQQLNAFDVLGHTHIILTKDAVDVLAKMTGDKKVLESKDRKKTKTKGVKKQ